MREIGGAIRGRTEVLGRFRKELEDRMRRERVSLGKAHAEAVRGIELKTGEVYRRDMEGSEERAVEAARTNGGSVFYDFERPIDSYTLRHWVQEEQMEQVREVKGEQAYESLKQAFERASQPLSPTQVSLSGGSKRQGEKRDDLEPEPPGPSR